MAAATAAGTAQAAAAKPVPQAAIRAEADTLRDAGTDPGRPEATGGEVSFLRARMANKVLKAQTAKVRLEKMKADLVVRNRAVAAVVLSMFARAGQRIAAVIQFFRGFAEALHCWNIPCNGD